MSNKIIMRTIPFFLSVSEYAKLCGVQNRAIYERIKKKTIAVLHIHGMDLIDTTQSPPSVMADYRNKNKIHIPILPDDIDRKNLFPVKHFAKIKKINPVFLYEQIILERYKGIIIGNEIFIDATSVVL